MNEKIKNVTAHLNFLNESLTNLTEIGSHIPVLIKDLYTIEVRILDNENKIKGIMGICLPQYDHVQISQYNSLRHHGVY